MITRRGRRGGGAASLTSARGLKLRARSHDDGLGVPRLRGDAAAHSLEAARERPARQDRAV